MSMAVNGPARLPVKKIIDQHRVFLIDNFGVLRTSSAPIIGAGETIRQIKGQGKRAIILTNTANYSPQQVAQNITEWHKLDFSEADVITSGMVLKPYFAEKALVGKRILSLGNIETGNYIRQAGGSVLDPLNIFDRLGEIEGVVVGWYPVADGEEARYLSVSNEMIHSAINALRISKGLPGVIANTDVTVPYDSTRVLYAGGALGAMIEMCAGRSLDRLGKPYRPIYDFAFSMVPDVSKDEILMVGDSLELDIKGANDAGIHSLLVMSGITQTDEEIKASPYKPDFVSPAFTLE